VLYIYMCVYVCMYIPCMYVYEVELNRGVCEINNVRGGGAD
jgi:hypothetical protein